jgi:X-Pro dipeptidyl-peptidase (S15 family)
VSVLCRFAAVPLSERRPGQTFSSNQASPKNVYASPRNIKQVKEVNATMDDEHGELELSDGAECLAWLTAQSWCNGSAGMRGISWGTIPRELL